MISCTEFIPLYSEFFTFLEEKGGHDAVMRYWIYISDNSIGDKSNPHSLISYLEKSGLDGAIEYWLNIAKEEACDVIRIIDPVKKTSYAHMRHCPSKGRLLEIKHITPYYDYCEHCNVLYQRVLSKYGIVFERDHSKVDNAECRSMLYMEGHRPGWEAAMDPEGKLVFDTKAEDNKYLHRDFHLSLDLALKYCGENFGDNCVVSFLTAYANHYYSPQIEDIKARGLVAIKEWLEKTYEIEEISEVLHAELTDDCLTVTIDKSPVIEYMRSLNQEPSKYYIEETRTLYSAIADACDLGFTLDYYKEDGATRYKFFKRNYSAE